MCGITIQRLEMTDNVDISVEDQLWARRFASHHNFGFGDSDDENDDWKSPDETYVVCFTFCFEMFVFNNLFLPFYYFHLHVFDFFTYCVLNILFLG